MSATARNPLRMTNLRHGYARIGKTKTYRAWTAMHARCKQTRPETRKNYLDRGITVCARWDVFENFLADMGEAPSGSSLDRVNNDRNYGPDNCRWATPRQQAQNRRSTKVTDKTALSILMALREGLKTSDVAKRFNISERMVRSIRSGERMPQAKAMLAASTEETK